MVDHLPYRIRLKMLQMVKMLMPRIITCFLEWLPLKERIKCIRKMSQKWIEKNFDDLPIKFIDIFYDKTWSFEFLENNLKPEDVNMWDHISTWYQLTDSFCESNLEWLNFHELVYSQILSKKFYLDHLDRIDWITSTLDKENLYTELYSRQ